MQLKILQPISPTDFQNSVYNTAVSYVSILMHNQYEILTISSGDKTSLNVLKAGALKALDGDEILLFVLWNIKYTAYWRCQSVYRFSGKWGCINCQTNGQTCYCHFKESDVKGIAPSIREMLYLAQSPQDVVPLIVEIEIWNISLACNLSRNVLMRWIVFLCGVFLSISHALETKQMYLKEPIFKASVFCNNHGWWDRPALVLVHGLGDEASAIWQNSLEAFVKEYFVIILDLPGFESLQKAMSCILLRIMQNRCIL